jgi:Na+:H+ antiporter, NhaC family
MGESAVLTPRRPSLVDVLVPLVALAVLIAGSLLLFGLDALDLYAPWAVFCFVSPALSVLYGFTGFTIEKVEPVVLDPSPGRE